MKGSPAICWENRVHRAQSTQRSRSSSTWLEMLIGLGNVRLMSTNRVSPRPLDIAWFCSGHSPPLSQTGQSSGWLISRNSMMPCCALSATSDVNCVLTTMPSATSIVQEACGLGNPRPLPASGMSTRHCRQAPTGSSSGWSQNLGIEMPRSSAARISRVPFGTLSWMSSMVSVTRFSTSVEGPSSRSTVMPSLLLPRLRGRARTASSRRGRTDTRRARDVRRYSSRKCLIEEMTGPVAKSPRAQNDRPAMLSHRSSSVSRSSELPSPRSSRSSTCTIHQVPSRHGVHLPHDSCL